MADGHVCVFVVHDDMVIKFSALSTNLKVFRHVHWAMHKDVAVERRLDGDHRLV